MKQYKHNKIFSMIKNTVIFLSVLLISLTIISDIEIVAEEVPDFSVNIIYQNDTDEVVTTSLYKQTMKSVLLADYNENEGGDFYGWTPTTLIDGIYEQAFAGWQLVKINGAEITETYIYPDNDYIYSNDLPFSDYEFTNSLTLVFKPFYGRRIYLRDEYNFKNINDVFGDGIATAKIDWDGDETGETGRKYAYSINEANASTTDDIENVGSRLNNPVSNIDDAITLLGTTGGEIVTVNHYTIKNDDSKYDYYNGKKTSGTYGLYFGKKITKGVVTYTGLNLGLDPELNGEEAEKKEEKKELKENFASTYQNAHWYCLDTRGNEGQNAHSFNFFFMCDTVLEAVNIVGYRETYKWDGSRYNSQVYFFTSVNKRFVMMESVAEYQRTTSAALGGKESTNWGYVAYTKNSVKLSALSTYGKGYLQLYSGFNSTATDGSENVYVTLFGNKTGSSYYDGFYHFSIVLKNSSNSAIAKAQVNNIHVYMSNITINSDFMGINQGTGRTFECNYYGIYLNNFENASSGGFTSTVYNTKNTRIKDLILVIDGDDSNQKLQNTYVGGMLETTGNETSTVEIDNARIIVNNKANITNLHGGGNQFAIETIITNDLTMDINGGTIGNLYGGCQGGMITADEININFNGGIVNNLYGGGAGGLVTCYTANSPLDISNYTYDDNFKYFAYENGNSRGMYIIGISIGLERQTITLGGKSSTYDVLTFQHTYAQGTTIYEFNKYYNTPQNICVSNALVTTSNGINININGGTIKYDVYGGGLNGSVESDININVTNGSIGGNIYGGGSGRSTTFSAKEFFNSGTFFNEFRNNGYDIKYTSNKDALDSVKFFELLENSTDTVYQNQISFLQEKGFSETFLNQNAKRIIQSSDLSKIDILKEDENGNKYIEIYSDTIQTLGSITGDTSLNISGGKITGNVFGGSDGHVAKINGETNVNISSGTINGKVYGGGNIAVVTNNTNVSIANVIISEIYGGGNVGAINGNTSVKVDGNAVIDNVFAGCNEANVGGSTNLVIDNGTILNTYGGNNQSGTIAMSISTTLNGGTITNLYGGGNVADTALDTNVIINGGMITNLYGGGQNALIKSSYIEVKNTVSNPIITNLYGGGYKGGTKNTNIVFENGTILESLYGGGYDGDVEANTNIIFNDGIITYSLYGGGYNGDVFGNSNIQFNGGMINQNIYGGGYEGTIDDNATILVNNGNISNIYGGGYEGYILGSTSITLNDGTISQNIYGGGFKGKVAVDTLIQINNGTINNIYGGGFEGNVDNQATIIITNGEVLNDVFGGGYKGRVVKTDITLKDGLVKGNLYGGGYSNDVDTDTLVKVNGAMIEKNIFGGGYEGNILGNTSINVTKGIVIENIYGGGFIGTARNTFVELVEDTDKYGDIKINGSIFGGGYGLTATVYETTNVIVDLNLEQSITEELVDTDTLTENPSGESAVEVSFTDGYSYVDGSIYGGGDLGQIGVGVINTSNNTATVSTSGHTSVLVKNGYIGGSVFGGGSGIPEDAAYQLEMGTIYGSTKTVINGGYIHNNVYGGGTQSRVYFSNLNNSNVTLATDVSIEELNNPIVINGSIFGGGDRGNSATTNASVHTTIGDVKVSINGNPSGSQIYFVTGGVYGDGNLCLSKGTRTIELNNFTTGQNNLKTFRSLQRANLVKLNNSDIVLLGAVDLVEEGDNTVYSINRINKLILENGSTVKLDQIVKFLGEIESDYEFIDGDNTKNRKFIDRGNNGTNDYKTSGGTTPDFLTTIEIENYRAGTVVSSLKNIICVANGLYLEIINEENVYGKVVGLFTLQLLRANEGEGGGFVYASIEDSTGTFICETKYGTDKPYMSIIGNVGGFNIDKYTYYCWFIQGDTITYSVDIEGYIGSDQTSYKEVTIIPEHTDNLYYVLNYIEVNNVLSNAIINNKYTLVQKNENLTDQEISLELYIGTRSLGFLSYTDGKWNINGKVGYESSADALLADFEKYSLCQFNFNKKDNDLDEIINNELNIVLHKSKGVNAEITNMKLELEIELFTDTKQSYSGGTSKLKYSIAFSIIRLVPEQMIYSGNDKMYSGLSESAVIKVTNGSAFTIEYQTRYIPIAFPKGTNEMMWVLSTKGYSYYMDKLGNYLTLDHSGNVVNISPLLTLNSNETDKVLVEKNTHGEYFYTHDSEQIELRLIASFQSTHLPKGTKITMIDMSLDGSPTYYYYVCKEDKMEINLDEFYLMGTRTTLFDSGITPEYKNLYYKKDAGEGGTQEASRVTERLIFVFDLEEVVKTDYQNIIDSVYSGNIVLNHLYGENLASGVDIMDFVKSDTTGDVKSYTRSTPKVVPYQINVDVTGVKQFEVEFEEVEYSENEIAEIIIAIEKDQEWTNTQLKNGKIGVKIMVTDDDPLPDGIEFRYNGVFLPKYGNKYLIVPLLNYGQYTIEVVNNLGSIATNEALKKAMFEATLCYLPDQQYFNQTIIKNTEISDFNIECDITDKVEVGFNVVLEDASIDFGSTEFNVQVFENNTQGDTLVEAYYVENGQLIATRYIYASKAITGSINGTINTIHISPNAKKGIYVLVFKNKEKEVTINIIIS